MSLPPLLLCDSSLYELTSENEVSTGRVVCPSFPDPHPCGGSEAYERLTRDGEPEILADAMATARVLIPGAVATSTPVVWSSTKGSQTQHINPAVLTVKIHRESVGVWKRLQLAHEAVHVVLPYDYDYKNVIPVYHWTHEMLAVTFAMHFVKETDPVGFAECSATMDLLAMGITNEEAMRYVDLASKREWNSSGGEARLFKMGMELGSDWDELSNMAVGLNGRPRPANELDAIVSRLG